MFKMIEKLYAELAGALGVADLPSDASGTLQLRLGDGTSIMLIAENESFLLLATAVLPLPADIGYGAMLWLMQRNHYDSPLAPFRLGCDDAGTIVLWGRLPTEGIGGTALAGLVEALGQEARTVREELGYGDAVAAG